MLKFYFKNHPEHKGTIKEVKIRIKAIEAEENAETVEESDEKVSAKKNKKTKKDAEAAEKLLSKKTQRKQSESEDSSAKKESSEKPKKIEKNETKKEESDEEEEEFNFQFKKPIVSEPKNKMPNAPFKRVSEAIAETLHDNFKDNSYETFMMKSGNTYGKEANDKLRIVRGKEFKKEKTKFKNKSSAGSLAISTEIKSIKLDLDSD